MPRRTRALPAPCSRQGQVWRALVPAAWRRSRPASPSDRPPGPAFGRPEDRLRVPPLLVTHGPVSSILRRTFPPWYASPSLGGAALAAAAHRYSKIFLITHDPQLILGGDMALAEFG